MEEDEERKQENNKQPKWCALFEDAKTLWKKSVQTKFGSRLCLQAIHGISDDRASFPNVTENGVRHVALRLKKRKVDSAHLFLLLPTHSASFAYSSSIQKEADPTRSTTRRRRNGLSYILSGPKVIIKIPSYLSGASATALLLARTPTSLGRELDPEHRNVSRAWFFLTFVRSFLK